MPNPTKTTSLLILGGIMSMLIIPAISYAAIETADDVIRVLGNIVGWTYQIFFIVAVFFILIAAFSFLTAKADPEKIKTARSQIFYAVIAIAIALISIGADMIVKSILE